MNQEMGARINIGFIALMALGTWSQYSASADRAGSLSIEADPALQNIQNTALKVVVLEGEGAINIIQQKTAVAPLVESSRSQRPTSVGCDRTVCDRERPRIVQRRADADGHDGCGRPCKGDRPDGNRTWRPANRSVGRV